MKCQVQWVDKVTGLPTPDTDEAVCIAVIQFWYSDNSTSITRYPCCAHHERQLDEMVGYGKMTAYDPSDKTKVLYHSQWTKEAL